MPSEALRWGGRAARRAATDGAGRVGAPGRRGVPGGRSARLGRGRGLAGRGRDGDPGRGRYGRPGGLPAGAARADPLRRAGREPARRRDRRAPVAADDAPSRRRPARGRAGRGRRRCRGPSAQRRAARPRRHLRPGRPDRARRPPDDLRLGHAGVGAHRRARRSLVRGAAAGLPRPLGRAVRRARRLDGRRRRPGRSSRAAWSTSTPAPARSWTASTPRWRRTRRRPRA